MNIGSKGRTYYATWDPISGPMNAPGMVMCISAMEEFQSAGMSVDEIRWEDYKEAGK